MIDLEFIADIERRFFRTEHDTGANINALMIWNLVRKEAGLPKLQVFDLTIAEEYCDEGRDAVAEREYPLMPRNEEEFERIKQERRNERAFQKFHINKNGQIVHLFYPGPGQGDASLCGAILDGEGQKRTVKQHDYVCTHCKFASRKIKVEDV